ncbi:hypothetical protein Rumeso_03399 [Rubellimicrobium mesophilum DSM 19309]|uniref:Acyltransferase n=1 Tax=Rubellimicrobium mesophilum DSM 19309 TaxID=442562 RepID=A0A017HL62_9RHOB|nr:acyltransferase [Rubellimicrobium mesophilum]EYD75071.1 hypothetical protein Rumeso_03399 [Rubellimicrobium mesophilum DSM 19309]
MMVRAVFRLAKGPLRVIDFVSPRLYMRIYLRLLRAVGVKVTGTPRYVSPGCKLDIFHLISLGDRVVISDRTVLLTHDYSLTTGLIAIGEQPETDKAFLRPVVIESNVFIGMGSMLLPGARVLENTIVGAGSVVRGTVGPNAIVMGNPAVQIGTLTEKAMRWRSPKDSGIGLQVDAK